MDQERIPRSLRKPGLMRLSSCFTVSADPYLTSSFLHSGRLTFATIFALQMRNPFGKQQPQINSRFRTISGIIVVHGFRVRTPDSAHNSPASALGGRKIAVFGPNHRGLLRSSHLQNKTSNFAGPMIDGCFRPGHDFSMPRECLLRILRSSQTNIGLPQLI